MKNSKTKSSIRKTKNLLIAGSIVCLLGFSGCSKNSPLNPNCLSGSWIKNVENELSAWTAAAQVYSENPTKENCENHKKAGLNYINALEKIKNCVPGGSQAEFNEAQQEAKDEINATTCD